jgi:hypothetical protein
MSEVVESNRPFQNSVEFLANLRQIVTQLGCSTKSGRTPFGAGIGLGAETGEVCMAG